VTDVNRIISQLEQHKASIDRAIEALREITAGGLTTNSASQTTASRGGAQTRHRLDGSQGVAAKNAGQRASNDASARHGPLKGRKMTEEQKRAISNAWTPERKQRFAEFHVQRMARERGEDPARALRDYRRRKQKDAGASGAQKRLHRSETKKAAPARKSVVRKTTPKKSAVSPVIAAVTSAA
jgi:hypothetical protein